MNIKSELMRISKLVMTKVDNAMSAEVFEAVRDAEQEAIESVVYAAYEPHIYERRRSNGGLSDPENIEMVGGRAANGVLRVVNTTEPDDRYPGSTTNKSLAELIEYGHGKAGNYDFAAPSWRRKKRYLEPRPFTAETIASLRESGDHVDALRAGLERQGLDVE